jgi:hypothetical protein
MSDQQIPLKRNVNNDKQKVATYEMDSALHEMYDRKVVTKQTIDMLKDSVEFRDVVRGFAREEIEKRFINNVSFWFLLLAVTVVGLLLGTYLQQFVF